MIDYRLAGTLLTLTFLMIGACSPAEQETSETVPIKKPSRVKTITIETDTFVQRLRLPGTATAERQVTLTAEVTGRVVKLNFDKGQTLAAGTPIVWIDDARINAEVARAEADRDMADLDYKKLLALRKRKANVSGFSLEQATLKLKAATAQVKSVQAIRAKHVIKSPFAGEVADRTVEVGAIVTPGVPIGRIVSLDPIRVRVGLPETAIVDFVLGRSGQISFDSFPDEKFEGKISFLAPEVDRLTRTVRSEITIANESGRIVPEMSAKVTFVQKTIPDSIMIPQTAVLELPKSHAVFVVDDAGVAHQREVILGPNTDKRVRVKQGLNAGERLVVTGHRNIVDGDRVTVVKEN